MAKIKIEREGDCLDLNIDNDQAEELMLKLLNEKYKGNGQEAPEEAPTEQPEPKAPKDILGAPQRTEAPGEGGEAESEEKPICKYCNSSNVQKNGTRELKDGETSQKWKCRDCGRTFCTRYSTMNTQKDIRKRAEELLREGKKPMIVKELVEEEFDIKLKRGTVYYWARNPRPEEEPTTHEERKQEALEAFDKKKASESATEPKEDATPGPTISAETGDEYSHLKPEQKKDLDLQIIEKKVMCPTKGKAVNIAICQTGCKGFIKMLKHYDDDEPYVRCEEAKIES